MRLLIKQRVFSWTDTYDVYDENENRKYFVKTEMFRMGHQIHVYDAAGNEIGMIKQRVFTLLPCFDIAIGGRRCEGDFMDWNYDVYAACSVVIHISKELFHWGDTYVLDIMNPQDEIPALMLAVAIDAANCSQGN